MRRLIVGFAVTIVLPGLVLGFFGVKALVQERQFRDQQIREQLARIAEHAGAQLESELAEWQHTADRLAANVANPGAWPERLHVIWRDPTAGVVFTGSRESPEIHPPGRLLYELQPSGEGNWRVRPALLEDAEVLELKEKQLEKAIDLYRQLAASARPQERAYYMHGLARTLKKAGRTVEAGQTYELLARQMPVRIGSLPSDFLARYATLSEDTALQLYRNLVDGLWRLEKSNYLFYSEQLRQRVPQTGTTRSLFAQEQERRALTAAGEYFLQTASASTDQSNAFFAFWNPNPFVAVVLRTSLVTARLERAIDSGQFNYSLSNHDLPDNNQPAVTYSLQNARLPLRLHVWPKDTAALYADAVDRQNLYLGILGVVLALLVSGSYFVVRTMKTELALAQMKSDFAATVSHEFRSPLTGINQLAEMLRDGRVADDRRRQEYYEMIVADTHRLRRLVDNILDFSRMESGRKQYHFKELESAIWLRELAEDFRSEAAGRGFTIESRIPRELPPILGDRETLTTAVHNLLDNALKYSGDARTVWIDVSCDGQRVSISVRDRGIGIHPEDRPRIFEKFYRGRKSSREVKGAGLGLNLVQHTVAAHGGRVEFETREGEGSTFTIHLNIARERA